MELQIPISMPTSPANQVALNHEIFPSVPNTNEVSNKLAGLPQETVMGGGE
jgi:hypothetical protein